MEKEELLSNATNDHDRELMRKDLDRFEKIHNKVKVLIVSAGLFVALGFLGLTFGEDHSILFFIPTVFLLPLAMYYNLKSTGLF